MPRPELFTDLLFTRTIYGTLITSSPFSSHIRQYGWGERNDDGFGIPYMTGFNGVSHLFVLFWIATYSREDVLDYRLLTVHNHFEQQDAQHRICGGDLQSSRRILSTVCVWQAKRWVKCRRVTSRVSLLSQVWYVVSDSEGSRGLFFFFSLGSWYLYWQV